MEKPLWMMIRGTDMSFTKEELRRIYDRTSGYCHICHKKLAWSNYGRIDARAPWQVEHSVPKAKGGTGGMKNLYPACIDCNCLKGVKSTRSARARNEKRCAPLSREKRARAKTRNAIAYGAVGTAVGYILCPPVALLTGLVGAHVGHRKNPDR